MIYNSDFYTENAIHIQPDFAAQMIQEGRTEIRGREYTLLEILEAVWCAGYDQGRHGAAVLTPPSDDV